MRMGTALPWLLLLGGALFTSACSGCCTTPETEGSVYVGEPQVNTRERLINDRLKEQQWLAAQLDKTDDLQPTVQGYSDLRLVSSFALGASASVSGKAKTEGDAGNGSDGGSGTDTGGDANAKSDGQTPAKPGSPPPAKDLKPEPTATKAERTSIEAYHDKAAYRDAIRADLKRARLDDAHDLAGNMLYDLNLDIGLVPGDKSTRYAQVTLWLTSDWDDTGSFRWLRPLFDQWREYLELSLAQETYKLQHRFDSRTLSEPDREFLAWFLEEYLPSARWELEQRSEAYEVLERGLNAAHMSYPNVHEFLRAVGDGVGETPVLAPSVKDKHVWTLELHDEEGVDRMKDRRDKPSGPRARPEPSANQNHFNKLVHKLEGAELKARTNSMHPNAVEEVLQWASGRDAPYNGNVHQAVRNLIPWAVWAKYYRDLRRIVDIWPPDVTDGQTRFEVREVPAFHVRKKSEEPEEEGTSAAANSNEPAADMKHADAAGANSHDTHAANGKAAETGLPTWRCSIGEALDWQFGKEGIHDTGFCLFGTRITDAERHPRAAVVEPQEYAQSISDVAARENLLSLAADVAAVTGNKARAGQLNTSYQRDRLETANALARKPLLVGFGMGRRRFGWVLGPRFVLEDGKPDFLHAPARHNVNAAITVPGWWSYVRIKGTYAWVKPDGSPGDAHCIWGRDDPEATLEPKCKDDGRRNEDHLTVVLPMPDDPMVEVTKALLLVRGGSGERFAVYKTRPAPSITLPKSRARQPLPSGPDTRGTILIRGAELWRNPQVLVGSQKAPEVEVLADMKGLLATFTDLRYPGDEVQRTKREAVSQDLTVITTFGATTREGAVSILPPVATDGS